MKKLKRDAYLVKREEAEMKNRQADHRQKEMRQEYDTNYLQSTSTTANLHTSCVQILYRQRRSNV